MSVPVAVLGSLVEAANPKPPATLVTDASLDATLTNTASTQRQVIRQLITNDILPLLNKLQAAPRNFDTGALATLQSDPLAVTWMKPATTRLPGAEPKRYDHKLRWCFQFDMHNAAQIVSDFTNDPGHSWSFPTTLAEAKTQFLELVQLKAVYLRTIAALDAAKTAGVSLSDALALYRREGDLVTPLPQSHIGALPPLERAFSFVITDAQFIGATMSKGLWSFPKAAFIAQTGTAAIAAGDPATFENLVKARAFIDWHLLIVGFDFLSKRSREAGRRWVEQLTAYTLLCDEFRTLNGLAGSVPDRVDEFKKQLDNLTMTESNGRLLVAATDPAFMVAHILGYALLFFKLSGRTEVDGPFIKPPTALMYLAYHTQDTRSFTDAIDDKFSWILASAAFNLAKLPTAPAYCANAYQSVKAFTLLPKLKDIPKGASKGTDGHKQVAEQIKTMTASDLDELAQFVLRADGQFVLRAEEWKAFKTHRTNIASYAHIVSYYKAVTP